jgi:site-specific recombinase XerD
MATVHIQTRKRKSGNSYVVYFKDPATSKLKYFKTFRKKREAQQAANDLRTLIDTGKTHEIRKNRSKLNFLTFEEVGRLLVKEWKRRLEEKDLKQKTFDEYCIRLRVLNRTFGKTLLCEISLEGLEDYVSKIASVHSNVTANRSLSVIRKVFGHGLKLKTIVDDNSKKVGFLSEKDHIRNRFLLPKELETLIEAAKTVRGKHYLPAMIYLGAEHGASKQEVLSLKWGDISFNYGELGLINFFRTKNMKERTDNLMPKTREALLTWRDHQVWARHRKKVEDNGSDLVFCRLNGEAVKRFDSAWRTALKVAGINNFHFHDLRHTFCSNLLLSGGSLKDAKEMIGHSDISMTDRYAHLTPEHMRARQKELARHYANGK